MKFLNQSVERFSQLFLLLGVSLISACATTPSIVPLSTNSEAGPGQSFGDPLEDGNNSPGGGGTGPGDGGTGPGGGGTGPGDGGTGPGVGGTGPGVGNTPDCSMAQILTTSISPSSAQKLNVMFLIDDSGSMVSIVQEVANRIQSFVQSLASSVSDPSNLRVGLMFDVNAQAFAGVNPFSSVINGTTVSHFNDRTNSQASDIAMFKRFAMNSFSQILSDPFPTDVRYFPNTAFALPMCADNQYERPTRHNLNVSGGSTSYCNAPQRMNAIETSFLSGSPLNLIAVSDDDLNTSYGDDVSNPEGSRFVANMYDSLTAPLGVGFVYHSIVGTTEGDFVPGSGDAANIVRRGDVHMMLSSLTGGSSYDVRTTDYGAMLNELVRQAVFSSQTISLACPISASRVPQIFFDGQPLSAALFQANVGENSILFHPSAFQDADMIQVEVRY